MIPNIFISSTINDLSHLRDSIRDSISEIGYNPIMSEYGGIGYLPNESAEDSCYLAMKDCQMAIIIIGKRYGSLGKKGLSITHNEFRAARDKNIPVIFLVNEEVLSFKRVFEVNGKKNEVEFPGMENPSSVFNLIREFSDSKINNGIIPFSNVQSAKYNLKRQLAHMVGDLLEKRFDPIQGEIKDILSEITTLRHILLKNEKNISKQFSIAYRFLLNEENEYLKNISENFAGSLENAVPILLKTSSLKLFSENFAIDYQVYNTLKAESILSFLPENNLEEKGINIVYTNQLPYKTTKQYASMGSKPSYDIKPDIPNDDLVIFGIGKKKLWANNNAIKLLNEMFMRLKETVEKSTIDNTV